MAEVLAPECASSRFAGCSGGKDTARAARDNSPMQTVAATPGAGGKSRLLTASPVHGCGYSGTAESSRRGKKSVEGTRQLAKAGHAT